MLKSVFIEYLVKNKERSNGSEFRLAKNAPPEIRKEMRKWRDRRVLSDLPYMVSDFLLEDLKAGKAKKDGDVYRRSRETRETTTVGALIEALKKFKPDVRVCVYDSLGTLVDPLELVDVGGGTVALPPSGEEYDDVPF